MRRLPLGRGVRLDVGHRHHTWAPDVVRVGGDRRILDCLDHRVRDSASVEALRAEVRDPLVGSGEVGVAKHRADVAGCAVRVEVDRRGRGDVVEEVHIGSIWSKNVWSTAKPWRATSMAGRSASASEIVP